MAWPPPVQATNRTNATPQLDTHVADHNAHALAINDLVAHVVGLGDPWRPADVVQAGMNASPLSGSPQDVALNNVAGNLGTYDVSTGHPAIRMARAAFIVGTLTVGFSAPAATGAVIVDTIYSALRVARVQLPVIAGIPAQYEIPLAENLGAGQIIYWQMTGVATAQTFNLGGIRIWESGPFGNSVH